MMEYLVELDKTIFYSINSLHTPWLDTVMYYVSHRSTWWALYVYLLYLILRDYRNESWAPIIGIAITIILADQVASTVLKPFVQRLRPSQDPSMQHLVHIVNNYRGGKFGFASSHAANTFGVAVFFWMLMGRQSKWIALLFPWAILVSYSRIYLGVHFPGDIIAGFVIGTAAALCGFYLFRRLHDFASRRRKPSAGQ